MRNQPDKTNGLHGYGDAGMGLGIYTADEADWLEKPPGLHYRLAQLRCHPDVRRCWPFTAADPLGDLMAYRHEEGAS